MLLSLRLVATRPTLVSLIKVCGVEQPGGVPRYLPQIFVAILQPSPLRESPGTALDRGKSRSTRGDTRNPRQMFEPCKSGALPA